MAKLYRKRCSKITKPQEDAQRDIMPHILEWELKKKKRQHKIEEKKKTVNSHWQRCGDTNANRIAVIQEDNMEVPSK